MKKIIFLSIFLFPLSLNAQDVSVQDVRELANIIAHPALAGRGTSQPGFDLAGNIIAMQLKNSGLYPLPQLENNYFHNFSFEKKMISEESRLIVSGRKEYEYKKDFLPMFFSGEESIQGEIAFVGFGISSEEDRYDDYLNIDVRDKIVVMLRHEPHEQIDSQYFNGREITRHSAFSSKIELAKQNGAIGVIIVEDVLNHIGLRDPIDFRSGPYVNLELPVFSVSLAAANEIIGRDLTDLQEEIERDYSPVSFVRKGVFLEMAFKENAIVRGSRNVIAYSPGKKRDEYILIGAHYDHLGVRGKIYPGADDNASGVTALLAIAEALKEENRFRKSIIFAFWGAEELGLIGSRYFVHDAIIPFDQIHAVINLDMVGRNDPSYLKAIGAENNENFPLLSPQMYKVLIEENEELENPFNIVLEDNENTFYRTDSAVFFQASPINRRLPVLTLTSGTHDDYHQPTDTVEKLDTDKIRNVAELARRILAELADEKNRPRYQ